MLKCLLISSTCPRRHSRAKCQTEACYVCMFQAGCSLAASGSRSQSWHCLL